jgi:hypothetical protein
MAVDNYSSGGDRSEQKVTMTNTTMQRMGRGCAGKRMIGGNPTTTVATSSASRPSVAWGIGH